MFMLLIGGRLISGFEPGYHTMSSVEECPDSHSFVGLIGCALV